MILKENDKLSLGKVKKKRKRKKKEKAVAKKESPVVPLVGNGFATYNLDNTLIGLVNNLEDDILADEYWR